MPYAWGTYTLLDLLAAQTPVVTFGEDNAFAAVQAAVDAHNRILNELLVDLVEVSSDQLRRYGGPASMQMVKVDEWARADAQKVTAGANIGFPLDPYQVSVQWTRFALERMMTQELAAQTTAALDSDLKNTQLLIKTAIFPTLDSTFIDKLGNGLILPIRPFLNADADPVPIGPNGEVWPPSTHTHYKGVATANTPTVGEVKSIIETVIEHYAAGQPLLYINKAQESTIRGYTADFAPYYDSRLTVATTQTRADGSLDPVALYDRAIGILDGAEVWTKPWMPIGYMFSFLRNSMKPLVMRVPAVGATGLRLMADNETFPLRAQTMQRVTGVSVWNRPNGAVLDCVTGSNTYTVPALSVT
jgi:hypothetical protein